MTHVSHHWADKASRKIMLIKGFQMALQAIIITTIFIPILVFMILPIAFRIQIPSINLSVAPILCHLPFAQTFITICSRPSISFPNVGTLAEIQLSVIKDSEIALSTHSIVLLDLRSAMRDVSTQIKHSDLTDKSKREFKVSLQLLIDATNKAAQNMEVLESRTKVTLGYFISYNRMMRDALHAIDRGHGRRQIEDALKSLDEAYHQVISGVERDMRKLEIQARVVSTYYMQMDEYLSRAYDTYVEEDKQQRAGNKRILAKAWRSFGADHIQRDLFDNNMNILNQFESERKTYQKQVDRMLNGVRSYINELTILRNEARDTLMEQHNIDSHIEKINRAIDELERKYNSKPVEELE
ncbi:hypothetical protein BC938DRAFT_474444 [Jimgerdemannia flammicorona]|uniref:Uncharacterized protein n=1 Tax=Jimgerdemannia flammicorona TaxID=994334 RepID=A0A433Q2B5_9FUNG|nr:hypothetical protein BC938DRAFT_474444 [Jimgerdemannia flammicorona]